MSAKPRRQHRQVRAAGRHQDWPSRLFDFVESRRRMPFAWGVQDCCLFACDGLRSITGLDPAAKLFRGQYRDAAGAARLVRKHGGVEAIAAAVCAAHGWPEVPPALAQRGDAVIIDTPDGLGAAVGLHLGDRLAFAGAEGVVYHPPAAARRAWAVARKEPA